jgi:hypothetical protein
VTRRAQAEYIEAVRQRYAVASKAEKGRLLDEVCRTRGRHRKAAIRSLRRRPRAPGRRRGRPPRHGGDVRAALEHIWEASGHLCGKLLVAVLPVFVAAVRGAPGVG